MTSCCVKKLIFNLKQKRQTPTDACNQISICCVSQGISKVLKQGQSGKYIFIVSHCPWSHVKLNKVIPNIYQNIISGWKQWTERRISLVCSSWFWLFYRPQQVIIKDTVLHQYIFSFVLKVKSPQLVILRSLIFV